MIALRDQSGKYVKQLADHIVCIHVMKAVMKDNGVKRCGLGHVMLMDVAHLI